MRTGMTTERQTNFQCAYCLQMQRCMRQHKHKLMQSSKMWVQSSSLMMSSFKELGGRKLWSARILHTARRKMQKWNSQFSTFLSFFLIYFLPILLFVFISSFTREHIFTSKQHLRTILCGAIYGFSIPHECIVVCLRMGRNTLKALLNYFSTKELPCKARGLKCHEICWFQPFFHRF